MASVFEDKTICDPVHGSIGISKLEQEIINSRVFQRLKKIKQLGLASFVFPGAEHSRFAHSIGAMHIMSQMIDRLSSVGCDKLKAGDEMTKQKLRLAALLHDIGHFPLAHLGEQVFQWAGEEELDEYLVGPKGLADQRLLLNAAKKHKSESAKHERLGEMILTSDSSELKHIIASHDYDPTEIAKIFNGEDRDNPFHTQLMSSTLDCDRMDFLMRDSRTSGTEYGRIDVAYLLKNLHWDEEKQLVCFLPKAVHAVEHFITARYFSYNLTYHKTVMGFELMAEALFFAMMSDDTFESNEYGPIVRCIDDVECKIKADDTFLSNFNDEYFWYYLELWRPADPVSRLLRNNLLNRIPLRLIYESRQLASPENGPRGDYKYLTNQLPSSAEFTACLHEHDLSLEHIAVTQSTILFEELPAFIRYDREINDEEKLKLVKIWDWDGGARDLVSRDSSLLYVLSRYKLDIARLYALVDKASDAEKALREKSREILKKLR